MSNKFIRKIDWYIIRKFLGTYFFSIALIISIAVVFDFNERMDKFMAHDAPWSAIIFEYYLNFIPYFSNLFSPLFVFIAVIFFTSRLADQSEIIAMLSTGMSFRRLMRPYMISAALISIVTITLSSYVIPKGSKVRIAFENKYYKKREVTNARNIQLIVDEGVVAYIGYYDNYSKSARRFSLDKFVDKKLVSHLTASRAIYDTTRVNTWTIKDYSIRTMEGMHETITRGTKMDTVINMDPDIFLVQRNEEMTMTSAELSDYIAKQKARGFANTKEFELEYHKRIAMAMASFILTIIGASLSSRKIKGGMGFQLGVGLALSFGYILFQTVSTTFAVNGSTPPIVAVWIPNIVYAGIAWYLYTKAPR